MEGLSVASMDEEALKAGDPPPTFYCYGTEDPFYSQFEAQYDLMQEVGVTTKRIGPAGLAPRLWRGRRLGGGLRPVVGAGVQPRLNVCLTKIFK